jgi:hypothetical protein
VKEGGRDRHLTTMGSQNKPGSRASELLAKLEILCIQLWKLTNDLLAF